MTGAIEARTSAEALAIALRLGADWLWQSERPMDEARILLADAVGVDRHRLPLLDVEDFSDAAMDRYVKALYRRMDGEPVSHIIRHRDFWEHRFEVTADVLDPRPETETLVAAGLEREFARVLDLGTGSGCILLSLLAARKEVRGLGTDLSEAALEVARRNGIKLKLDERAQFVVSDWFKAVEGRFDLIVSNPPYIAASEMAGLQPELSYEPRIALTDEGDGLSAYRAITAGAPGHLTSGGWLMVEVGAGRAEAVASLFAAAGLVNIATRPDMDGRPRVVLGQAA